MAQEYKLTGFEKGDFQDKFGNYWCTAIFQGVGEPVKWVVKDPTAVEVGKEYYGEIKDATSQAGKAYLRFHREQREEQQQSAFSGSTGKKDWQPRDDDAIRAQWAIGQAIAYAKDADFGDYDTIENVAKKLFAMVNRVKGSSESTDLKAQIKSDDDLDADAQSLYASVAGGSDVSLDDIPF